MAKYINPFTDYDEYERSLKIYRDNFSVIQTAKEEQKLEIAKNLLDVLDDDIIAIKTGLSVEEVKNLRS